MSHPFIPKLSEFPEALEMIRVELVGIRSNLDEDGDSIEAVAESLGQLTDVQLNLVRRLQELVERLIRDKEKNGPRPR
jgi:hypothetical protein